MARAEGVPAELPAFEPSGFEGTLAGRLPGRWMGWRLRLLVGLALLGCLGVFVLARLLAQAPVIDASWQAGPRDQAILLASGDPALQPLAGRAIVSLAAGGQTLPLRAALLFGAPRWTIDDAERTRLVQERQALSALLGQELVVLRADDGSEHASRPRSRGVAGLGLTFWLLAVPALLLYLTAVVVMLARPRRLSALFGVMAVSQALSLLWLAADAGRGLGAMPAWLADDLPWRLGLDLATAAAAMHAVTLYPVALPGRRWSIAAAWGVAGMVALLAVQGPWPGLWWWGVLATLGLGVATAALLARSHRVEPNPFAVLLRRLTMLVLVTLAAVYGAVTVAMSRPPMAYDIAAAAVLVWTLFLATVLVWVPFLSRGRQTLREFAMLAGLSTVATSLDLLFVSLFALEPIASLTLAVFIALGIYAAVRQWLLNQVTGSGLLTTERTFEQLYRVAREVQKHPEQHGALLGRLLKDLFEPLELMTVTRGEPHSRVAADGAALIVPVRPAEPVDGERPQSLVLRFARRGQRLFTPEDARLTDRVVEQLRRAVAYDRAVERGRAEERLRIAQDLHDDIGARLLTLMYKAQDPEMEDYLRHTLLDLKTLTRGLAASGRLLSESAAEWKADLQQRLTAAGIRLDWSFSIDEDIELGVVQWSALTRVMRELVTNAIYHARATRLAITASLEGGRFSLTVVDDGVGRAPQAWAHGLGLGGVRKRVKQLGGDVGWHENGARGIRCEVVVPALAASR